ncbi:hypothetical protein KOW79_008717 [Hemibagrus wyckioides]|uniref:Uncharacterized protein n=1 Tax=Hemibagrus wyckioides TaxID=337641 RepID=A0A9D3SJR9_9TELE|nr:hypothetical protein KOW79_008717 [Hemibagrus wyckioides]
MGYTVKLLTFLSKAQEEMSLEPPEPQEPLICSRGRPSPCPDLRISFPAPCPEPCDILITCLRRSQTSRDEPFMIGLFGVCHAALMSGYPALMAETALLRGAHQQRWKRLKTLLPR